MSHPRQECQVLFPVLGGAEDGHVLGNATVEIQGNAVESTTTYADIFEGRATKIGTLGTSYVDGNIFGGGTGTVSIGTQTDYQAHYGGEVYGASRGVTNLDPNQYSSVVWTLVKILNGANIQGNVFGGGDAGSVKKDSEVIIGAPAN